MTEAWQPAGARELRLGLAGLGSMGRNHLRVLNDLECAEPAGLADAHEPTAQRAARPYGIPAYTDYRELLDKERPQAVVVAVPTVMHCEVAMEAISRGAHLLVDALAVVDKTGFAEVFDVKLAFLPDQSSALLPPPPPDAAAALDPRFPSIVTALHEQLGLRVRGLEASTLIELTAFGTAVIMNYRHTNVIDGSEAEEE